MTATLKAKNDDEIEIDNMHKKHKLGKWGAGLHKSMYEYDASEQQDTSQVYIDIEMYENNDISNIGEDGEILGED